MTDQERMPAPQAETTPDQYSKEIMEASIDTLRQEIEVMEKQAEDLKKSKANFEEQWKVDEEFYKLLSQKDALTKITPEINIEKNPRYWELKQQKLYYQIRQDSHLAKEKIKGFDIGITKLETEVVEAKKKLTSLNARLGNRHGRRRNDKR